MQDKLRQYIDALFADAPQNKKTIELKEEMLQNLTDKYNDLLAEGKTEDAAYNLAVASVGDISELIEQLREHTQQQTMPIAAMERERRRSAILVSVAVALYILSVIPPILTRDAVLGPVMMFIMIALATALIIYNGMTRVKYTKVDDTVVEEFKEWQSSSSNKRQAFRAISSALWALTVVVYVLVSFGSGMWHITWVIFLIAAAINAVIKAIFDLKR